MILLFDENIFLNDRTCQELEGKIATEYINTRESTFWKADVAERCGVVGLTLKLPVQEAPQSRDGRRVAPSPHAPEEAGGGLAGVGPELPGSVTVALRQLPAQMPAFPRGGRRPSLPGVLPGRWPGRQREAQRPSHRPAALSVSLEGSSWVPRKAFWGWGGVGGRAEETGLAGVRDL